MSTHPINLAIRFLLEMASLLLTGIWGWQQAVGGMRYFLAIGTPLLLATVWGTFAVPNDPSRSGKTIVKIKGILRLILELAFFSFATWTAWDLRFELLSLVFGLVALGHYLFSLDRLKWLVAQK